jgi:hypothetical protein
MTADEAGPPSDEDRTLRAGAVQPNHEENRRS